MRNNTKGLLYKELKKYNNMKKLIINGELIAKYEYDLENEMIFIKCKNPNALENILVALISVLDEVTISKIAYLNVEL